MLPNTFILYIKQALKTQYFLWDLRVVIAVFLKIQVPSDAVLCQPVRRNVLKYHSAALIFRVNIYWSTCHTCNISENFNSQNTLCLSNVIKLFTMHSFRSSGPPVPPYDYNGFLASLEFVEQSSSTESSNIIPIKTTEPGVMSKSSLYNLYMLRN
jgi:hypothetical protein